MYFFAFCASQITVPEEERIDTGAIYTQLSLQDLKEEVSTTNNRQTRAPPPSTPHFPQVPQIDWEEYFDTVLSGVSYGQEERIVSYSMPYFRELGKVLNNTEKR